MLRKHKRLTKKELKKDPLLTFIGEAYDYFEREWIKIVSIVGGVILIVVLALFIGRGRNRAEINAYDAAFNALRNNAPEAPDLLRRVVDDHGGSESAAMALLSLGTYYFQNEEYEQSEEQFSEYIDKYSGDMLSDYSAFNGLGGVYEQEEMFDKAAGIYEEYLKKYPKSPFNDTIRMSAARAYLNAGEKDKARSLFSDIVGEEKDSPEKQEAKFYLSTLD